jgi:hypothetical protein
MKHIASIEKVFNMETARLQRCCRHTSSDRNGSNKLPGTQQISPEH